jgi:hyaluronan synthase
VFVFLLQLRDTITHHTLYLFTLYIALVWLVWGVKASLSRAYRPARGCYSTTTAVVVPVVDEPPELFRDVLRRIVAQRPTEVHVVINGPRNPVLEVVCAEVPGVGWAWTPQAGKRNAIRIGVEASRSDVVVLVDSDTVWAPDTLDELVKPFVSPSVGGVTTRQRVLDPGRHVLTSWADWMENLRNEYSMPAMSVLGTVGCLPGRTIAFRRRVLVDAMDNFLNQRFLGVFLEVSDDRTLTNEALKQGYRTVYQSTSQVWTDAPTTWAKMARQQFRWARGSQYNTLRMVPWMVRNARTLAFFYLCDILLPFLLLGSLTGWLVRRLTGTDQDLFEGFVLRYGTIGGPLLVAGLTVAASMLSAAIRQSRHLRSRPSDLLRIPTYLLISTFMLMPIRMLGFVRMGHDAGWGTRSGGYAGERSRNRLVVLPYLLGVALVVGGALYHL